MPRVARPDFAQRVSTYLSAEQTAALEAAAREETATVAHVLRQAVREYLARRAEPRTEPRPHYLPSEVIARMAER